MTSHLWNVYDATCVVLVAKFQHQQILLHLFRPRQQCRGCQFVLLQMSQCPPQPRNTKETIGKNEPIPKRITIKQLKPSHDER
jgi:hypothetical protein